MFIHIQYMLQRVSATQEHICIILVQSASWCIIERKSNKPPNRTPPMCPGPLKNYTIRFFNWKPPIKCLKPPPVSKIQSLCKYLYYNSMYEVVCTLEREKKYYPINSKLNSIHNSNRLVLYYLKLSCITLSSSVTFLSHIRCFFILIFRENFFILLYVFGIVYKMYYKNIVFVCIHICTGLRSVAPAILNSIFVFAFILMYVQRTSSHTSGRTTKKNERLFHEFFS